MQELSETLRRERELLDQLRFRFVEARLLLAARETRYLAWATAEIDQARQRAREADLLRAAHVHRLVNESDRPWVASPTLRDVAAMSEEPWACILRDHHEGLCALVSEIEVIGHRNAELAHECIRQLADRAGPSLFDSLLQIEAHEAADAAAGAGGTQMSTPSLVLDPDAWEAQRVDQLADERGYQAVISVASRLRMPALLAFLR